MIKNNSYYEFFASYKVPNGDQVGYWIDLGANPNGKVIKVYNSNIRKWVKVTDATSEDAVAPYIGSNGNWFVDSRDTGVPASGKNPYVGDNGNWFVFDALENKYVDSGVVAKGKTAYDIAVENGYDGSYDDYIKVLQDIITYSELVKEATANANVAAESANNAADRSNTIANNPPKIVNEVWYAYDEETGSYVSTGVKAIGDAFTIVKTYTSVANMQADYTGGDVKIGQFVMIDTGDVNNPEDSQLYLKGDTEWKFISDLSGAEGIQGLSAYQVAVQEGFVGTEEEWIQSLKGDKGDKGEQGIQGIKGEKGDPFTYEDFTEDQLQGLVGPQGEQGEKGEKGDPFEYSDFTPEQLEGLKGPKGDTGNTGPQGEPGIAATIEVGETVTLEPGESALVENVGNETNAVLKFSLPKGAKGDKGDKGDTGEGVNIKGELASENDLPADGQPGDAYIIDGNLYVYVGEGGSVVTNPKWSNVGNIKGEKGDQGEQGPQGDPGPKGEQGEPGKDGIAATIEVGTVTSSEPGTQPIIANVGDSTNAIFNFTIPKGEKGDKGDQGEKGEPGEPYSLPIASSDTLGGVKVGSGLSVTEDGTLNANVTEISWEGITGKPEFKTVATTGSYNDLTDKPTIPTKVSELENDSNYLTSVPEEYVTETELAGKNYATEAWVGEQGYLTEHQDISNLATKEELALKADSTNVYSKSETYTKTETDSAIKQASATVFKYKGAVDNYEGLPTEDVYVGDVYSLRDTNGEYVAIKASPEPTWEFLGVEVDLSDYSTTEQNDAKYQPKGEYLTSEDQDVVNIFDMYISDFSNGTISQENLQKLNNIIDQNKSVRITGSNEGVFLDLKCTCIKYFTAIVIITYLGTDSDSLQYMIFTINSDDLTVTTDSRKLSYDSSVTKSANLNGYTKTSSTSDITETDTINSAISKLENRLNNKIEDAPSDGKQYARKDGTWEEVKVGDQITKANIEKVFTGNIESHTHNSVYELIESEVDTWDGSTVSDSIQGKGTEDDPYLIQSCADLLYVRNNFTTYKAENKLISFKITKSLDFNNKTVPSIEKSEDAGLGIIIDGGNFTISNFIATDGLPLFNNGMACAFYNFILKNISLTINVSISSGAGSESEVYGFFTGEGDMYSIICNNSIKGKLVINGNLDKSYSIMNMLNSGVMADIYYGSIFGNILGANESYIITEIEIEDNTVKNNGAKLTVMNYVTGATGRYVSNIVGYDNSYSNATDFSAEGDPIFEGDTCVFYAIIYAKSTNFYVNKQKNSLGFAQSVDGNKMSVQTSTVKSLEELKSDDFIYELNSNLVFPVFAKDKSTGLPTIGNINSTFTGYVPQNSFETFVNKFNFSGEGTKALTNSGEYKAFTPLVEIHEENNIINSGISITSNTYYKFGEATGNITFTLDDRNEIQGAYNEYMIEFKTGETVPTIRVADDNSSEIKWLGGEQPALEANKTYQISIVNNLAVMASF